MNRFLNHSESQFHHQQNVLIALLTTLGSMRIHSMQNKRKLPSSDFQATSPDLKSTWYRNTFHEILFSKKGTFVFWNFRDYNWMYKTNELNKPASPYLQTANSLKQTWYCQIAFPHPPSCVQCTAWPKVCKPRGRSTFQLCVNCGNGDEYQSASCLLFQHQK